MSALNHLLTASDLSEASHHVLDRGFQLAQASGARYTVMHALGLQVMTGLWDMLGERSEGAARKLEAHQRDVIARQVAAADRQRGVPVSIRVVEGAPASVIPEQAREMGVDLVLVGAHGAGFLQRLLLGSTASRLLRKSHCPLLVVRNPVADAYSRALVAVDFSPGSELAIRKVRLLAPRAHLHLLHVFDLPFESMLRYADVTEETIHQYRVQAREKAMRQLHEMAREVGLSPLDYTPLVLHGDATRLILTLEEEHGCDLLVLGKHGIHVTEELLLGSVTKRVLAESEADVLVVVDARPRSPEED
ncbi:universal stress protein [Zoogloea sp.]|uniref:universal stress protein n=1 Tax=Zoogloea sp. TaxID=49181 RepID=UPI002627AC4A|nr:universal stress protein [Zoogloea sp.]MDD3354324.1 universal stress protein [Zoogloea sp.]